MGDLLCICVVRYQLSRQHGSAVLLGDNGRDVKLADAGLAAFMHHDYMAAKSNLGPFIYTVGSLHCAALENQHHRPSQPAYSSVKSAKVTKQTYIATASGLQAPEVVYGIPGAASPAADIYSFGVLLWQLCTGTDPALDRKRMLWSVYGYDVYC